MQLVGQQVACSIIQWKPFDVAACRLRPCLASLRDDVIPGVGNPKAINVRDNQDRRSSWLVRASYIRCQRTEGDVLALELTRLDSAQTARLVCRSHVSCVCSTDRAELC